VGIAEDMKNLAEDIAASYDVRVKALGQLVTDTHGMLDRFSKEQKEMAAAMEDALAKGESVRKEDFQKMLKDIQTRQKEREREVDDLLKGFREEQEKMASEWEKLTALMEEKRSGIKVPMVEVREKVSTVEEKVEAIKAEKPKRAKEEVAEAVKAEVEEPQG
jgi:hypothetical protein